MKFIEFRTACDEIYMDLVVKTPGNADFIRDFNTRSIAYDDYEVKAFNICDGKIFATIEGERQ